jgi:hypothetical protein
VLDLAHLTDLGHPVPRPSAHPDGLAIDKPWHRRIVVPSAIRPARRPESLEDIRLHLIGQDGCGLLGVIGERQSGPSAPAAVDGEMVRDVARRREVDGDGRLDQVRGKVTEHAAERLIVGSLDLVESHLTRVALHVGTCVAGLPLGLGAAPSSVLAVACTAPPGKGKRTDKQKQPDGPEPDPQEDATTS